MRKVCVIPGDGIGREVIPRAAEAISVLAPELELIECEAGLSTRKEKGTFLPDSTKEIIGESDAILFGAITSPPPGTEYTSPLLWMRRNFQLYANVRPARSLLPSSRRIDVTIIRENTEGLYSGVEREEDGKYITERVLTEKGMERIVDFALDYALKDKKRITAAHKANVLRKSDGAFRRIFLEGAEKKGVKADDMYVDAVAHDLVVNPSKFDVIVTLNMYGDILSDLTAGLAGGLGLAPSASIGENKALFEPVHGSAPDIAGKGVANPTAALLSAALLLEYFGYEEEAEELKNAVTGVIGAGYGTPDIGGKESTESFADMVIRKLDG